MSTRMMAVHVMAVHGRGSVPLCRSDSSLVPPHYGVGTGTENWIPYKRNASALASVINV